MLQNFLSSLAICRIRLHVLTQLSGGEQPSDAESLDCSFRDFAVLPQLKFQLAIQHDQKALKKLGSREAVLLAQVLICAAVEINLTPDAANNLLQTDRPDIDSGEAVLFAAQKIPVFFRSSPILNDLLVKLETED